MGQDPTQVAVEREGSGEALEGAIDALLNFDFEEVEETPREDFEDGCLSCS